ncbi:glycosyltransferase family 4 protein [Viridothelium virens]|uniref:Glycosyltransferase family 4 protein n=1 Tax=Viridothelium virens TaxID=1048519 RepID=A0A6A6HKP7_VIRVR|nr:glycosyltransferase family 4 protein [Viridothelium virens]
MSVSETQDLLVLYLGIAAKEVDNEQIEIAFCVHDGVYSTDFAVDTFRHQSDRDRAQKVADYVVRRIREYEQGQMHKYAGAGITVHTKEISPTLPSRLWLELDIVPMIFEKTVGSENGTGNNEFDVDEEADSMARKCIMYFGPTMQPHIQVGFRNEVEVDSGGTAQLTALEQYEKGVSEKTWNATLKYAKALRKNNIKIAFFSSTPQGGGVALMRHALVRFLRQLGVKVKWYVPRPKPEVFRITKTNHNILQGVADPGERFTDDQARILADWVEQNAKRFWTPKGGPLAPRAFGGADFINVDDPQMPGLATIAKEQDPDRPVTWRSHIQVRSDLVDQKDSPTAYVWQWLYDSIRFADVFISHPVRAFVPNTIDLEKVSYMPATTDWLDGLNKGLSDWDAGHYIRDVNIEGHRRKVPELQYPSRSYIVQIARFDPSKGIPDVIASYATYRRNYVQHLPRDKTPQLVIAGHGSVDDPDATRVLAESLDAMHQSYSDIADDIVALRLGPTDQLLNALMSSAKVALQLSTREGFEVKVSEAIHKGIPMIATNAGGIPLQVEHGKSGFIVEPGDHQAVARYLDLLFRDEKAYARMSNYAKTHVSDEVCTVGNALCWLYLADTMTKGKQGKPKGRWVYDMARQGAGEEFDKEEVRLPRNEELHTV